MIIPLADLLLTAAPDFSAWSSDPSRVDYADAAYRAMAPRWQLVKDVRDLAAQARRSPATYLPKFEAESAKDWAARVAMTFGSDAYESTLTEHVGLILAIPPHLDADVPQRLRDLCEDIDGEGNHVEVFAASALDAALHFGHAVLLTDYPDASAVRWLSEEQRLQARPYVQLYRAPDVYSSLWITVGGVALLVRLMLRETVQATEGAFGTKETTGFRELWQDVTVDEATGRLTGLGAIHWRTYRATEAQQGGAPAPFAPADEGIMRGPARIPARIIYGGEQLGRLYTMPHLFGLAMSAVEEVQVLSDYANVMHKCNVPTPIFIGRSVENQGADVPMGQGIDVPIGGDAKMLEPSGNALSATRQRLEDIAARMRRQGATSAEGSSKTMTATEAALYAAQRNARLTRAARSLQDALEGVLADMAAFLNVGERGAVRSGGSVIVNQNFAGLQLDPALLKVYMDAHTAGVLPLDATLYALKNGRLPDDFSETDAALHLLAEEQARQNQAALDAASAKTAAGAGSDIAPKPAPTTMAA